MGNVLSSLATFGEDDKRSPSRKGRYRSRENHHCNSYEEAPAKYDLNATLNGVLVACEDLIKAETENAQLRNQDRLERRKHRKKRSVIAQVQPQPQQQTPEVPLQGHLPVPHVSASEMHDVHPPLPQTTRNEMAYPTDFPGVPGAFPPAMGTNGENYTNAEYELITRTSKHGSTPAKCGTLRHRREW
ncbi:hypothetical protein LOZ43_001557 [Ophidiomyces ophidiicola]|nr:hypothetical protein LOZ43_001557 [Ophidiomyces ophidiicola]